MANGFAPESATPPDENGIKSKKPKGKKTNLLYLSSFVTGYSFPTTCLAWQKSIFPFQDLEDNVIAKCN